MHKIKSGRLRHRSKKRQVFDAENKPWKDAFIAEVGHCQWCGCKEGETHPDGHYAMALCVHELCPGANRQKSISAGRECCMVVCWFCNSVKLPGTKLAKQIAAKAVDGIRARLDFQAESRSQREQLVIERVRYIIAAIRAVKDNGRKPIVVTVEDVRKELELL